MKQARGEAVPVVEEETLPVLVRPRRLVQLVVAGDGPAIASVAGVASVQKGSRVISWTRRSMII